MVAKVLELDGDHAKFLNPGRVPLRRIKNFLTWLVNLNIDDPAATEKFLREYSDFFFPNQQFRRHQEIAALIDKGELPRPPKITPGYDDQWHVVLNPGTLEGELSPEQQARARHLIIEHPHRWVQTAWTDYSIPHLRQLHKVLSRGSAEESYDPRERNGFSTRCAISSGIGLVGLQIIPRRYGRQFSFGTARQTTVSSRPWNTSGAICLWQNFAPTDFATVVSLTSWRDERASFTALMNALRLQRRPPS